MKRQLLNFLFEGKDAWGMPYGIYIDKVEDDEWEVFIYGCLIGDGQRMAGSFFMKGEDLDYDENRDFGNDIEEIRSRGRSVLLEASESRKKVVLDRRKTRDVPLEGPNHENCLEYLKRREDYTTSDVIQDYVR